MPSAVLALVVLVSFSVLPFLFGSELRPVLLVGCGFITSVVVFAISHVLFRRTVQQAEAALESVRQDINRLKRDYMKSKSIVDEQQGRILRISSFQSSLSSIAQQTMQSLEIGKVLQFIMDTVVRAVAAKKASLWLVDPETGRIELEAAEGWSDEDKASVTITMGRGIVGHVAANGVALDAATVSRDTRLKSLKKGSPIPTVICSPLVHNREILGVLNVEETDAKRAFNLQEDVRLITFLCSLAAMAIKNARMFGDAKELANTDGLTRLYTHRYFQEVLDGEMRRAERYGDRVSLIITDIDHFKSFNDTYGHQIGDLVLRETASVFKACRREIDVVARYGGEEFALVLPNTLRDGAVTLAERLRQAIESHEYESEKGILRVTISIGVATFPDDAADKSTLIQKADQALYRAKEGGRNQVRHAGETVAGTA